MTVKPNFRSVPASLRWLALIGLLAACTTTPTPAPAPTVAPSTTTAAAASTTVATGVVTDVLSATATADATTAALNSSILTLPFTDIHSGQNLTLASFAGKTVLVEGMAAWCSNCLAQQQQVALARQKFGANVIDISLGIDVSEDAPLLLKYAADKGFTWTFGLANKPLMDALVAKYGRAVTNPSNTPMFIVAPDGTLSALISGGHSADDLVSQVSKTSGT